MANFPRAALILFFVIFGASHGAAQSYSTLQNLPGVGVAVRGLTATAEQFGLAEADVRRKVEQALKKANAAVLTEEAMQSAPGSPVLEVTVHLSRFRDSSYLYTIQAALREVVQLERQTDLVTVPAATWERVSHGIASSPVRVTLSLERLLDLFVEEYREAGGGRG